MKLLSHQVSLVANSLRAAADVYTGCAERSAGNDRLVFQFKTQATDALMLADLFDSADEVTI